MMKNITLASGLYFEGNVTSLEGFEQNSGGQEPLGKLPLIVGEREA